MDFLVQDIRDSWGGVGLTTWSIDSDGNVCSIGVDGERVKGSGEPFLTTAESRHHIGSVTKSMTSTLLAILIEQGEIAGWNATIAELVSFENTNYGNVTLRELVGMISGIPSDLDLETIPDYDETDLRAGRRAIALATLRTTPGTKTFAYSNFAYIIAGHAIEEITGETWEESLSRLLFKPLGVDLGDNFVGPPNNNLDPWGHSGDNLVPCNPNEAFCDNPLVIGPAGTVSCPVSAMAKYFSYHMQCHQGTIPSGDEAAELLSQESCQTLHQPADSSISAYGYGWVCYDHPEHGSICTHNGSNLWNYYNATLVFEQGMVYTGFTNGYRPSNLEDLQMVNEAVEATMYEELECTAPFESSDTSETSSSTVTFNHGLFAFAPLAIMSILSTNH